MTAMFDTELSPVTLMWFVFLFSDTPGSGVPSVLLNGATPNQLSWSTVAVGHSSTPQNAVMWDLMAITWA